MKKELHIHRHDVLDHLPLVLAVVHRRQRQPMFDADVAVVVDVADEHPAAFGLVVVAFVVFQPVLQCHCPPILVAVVVVALIRNYIP